MCLSSIHRRVFRSACNAILISLLPLPSFAQQGPVHAPHAPVPPLIPPSEWRPLPPGKPGSMTGGIWMIDANFKSTLHLRNVVETSGMTVTPILHLSNGVQYKLAPVQLGPAATATVDINAGLQNLGIVPYATLSGYVEVQYNWPWNPLCATVQNVDPVHSLLFNYDLHTLNRSSGVPTPNTFEGLWWKQEANVSGFVALANTSAGPITASMQVSDSQANPIAQHAVTISPGGMKIVDLSELNNTNGISGGLTVTYNGMSSDLIVNGGLEDQSTGYSANIPFAETSNTPATTLKAQPDIAALGLMVGPADPMLSFPAGTIFTPYSVLRNISKSTVVVTPTLWWMASGTAKSAQVASITLSPSQSTSLNVPSFLSAAGLGAFSGSFNLVLSVQGNPGALLATAGSVDQTNTYVFAVSPHGIVESAGKSISYWSTGNGDDTMVTLWNPADEAQDFIFWLYFTGGQYGLPVHLAARETRMFNISQVIQNQVPDREGNIIPPNVTEGSAKLIGSLADNQIVLAGMDAGTYNVHKATCGEYCQTCDGYETAAISTASFNVLLSGQVQETFTDIWDTGYQHDMTAVADWLSCNPAIASVSGGLVTGLSGGPACIDANYSSEPVYTGEACMPYVWFCPLAEGVGAGTSGTVQAPTSLKVLEPVTVLPDGIGVSGPPYGCDSTNPYGIKVDIQYQVLDQNGDPIQSSQMIPWETGTYFFSGTFNGPIGPVPGYPTSTKYTSSSGTFHDVPWGGCTNGPFPPPTASSTQNINMVLPNGSHSQTVRSQTFTVTGDAYGEGTITNGSDISATR